MHPDVPNIYFAAVGSVFGSRDPIFDGTDCKVGGSSALRVPISRLKYDHGTELCPAGVSMVVVPGLSESMDAIGKRIIRLDVIDSMLAVEAASSAQRARCPTCSHR